MSHHDEENDLIKQRRAKLEALAKGGVYAYGGRFEASSSIQALTDDFAEGKAVSLAGRIMAAREHGKSLFYDIKDSGAKIQVYVKEDIVGAGVYTSLKNFDIGDFVGGQGETFKTRTAEPTVKVTAITMLAKSLRPLPAKWHGLKDVET